MNNEIANNIVNSSANNTNNEIAHSTANILTNTNIIINYLANKRQPLTQSDLTLNTSTGHKVIKSRFLGLIFVCFFFIPRRVTFVNSTGRGETRGLGGFGFLDSFCLCLFGFTCVILFVSPISVENQAIP